MEKKAIILSRVSSEHQTLEQQTEAVLKEVEKDGYSDDNIIIIEDKESASLPSDFPSAVIKVGNFR